MQKQDLYNKVMDIPVKLELARVSTHSRKIAVLVNIISTVS